MLCVSEMKCYPIVVLALLILSAPAVVAAADADDYVAEARAYAAKNEIPAAIIELKNALQKDPTHVAARVLLGRLYLREPNAAAARKEFGRARDLGAPTRDWLSGYARALLMLGEFDKLLDEVQVGEDLGTSLKAELHAVRGNAYLAFRRVEEAVASYDKALALEKGNPMASLGKAQILLRQRKEEEAMLALDEVLLAHPGHVETRLVRGDLNRRSQKLEAAEADYERVTKEAPKNARAYIGLALVHIAQRKIDLAKADLKKLRRLAKGIPAVNYLQGLVSFQEKDYERAADELQILLRQAPGNLQAQLLYGIVSYARGQFTIADDYLSRVLTSVPGNTQIVKLLGAARLKLRQPERALEVLESAVEDDTRDVQLLALMGTALIQSGDNTRGAAFVERAVEIDPDQALLRTQLAVGRIATGDTGAAISQLESAVALGQDVIQADVLLVLSYLNKRELDKAITAAYALEKRMPDSPIPFNLTGLAFLAQREFDQAASRFRQALEIDPKFMVAQMNLARLALAKRAPKEAETAFRKVLETDPKHIDAMMGLAALTQSQKDHKATIEWLAKANGADPTSLKPMLALAEVYLKQRDGLKAANALSGLSPEQSELPAALRLRGMAQLQTGDFSSAVFTLEQLTKKRPESIEAWFQLGRARVAAGDVAGARESFRRATELDTNYRVPLVWVGSAELELREKRFEQALALAAVLKQRFPDSVAGLDIEAAAQRGLGNADAALAAAEAALAVDRSARRVNAVAVAMLAAKQQPRAVELLRAWLNDNPADANSWSNLGLIYQQDGDDTRALAAYEQALKHGESRAVTLNNMAWLYLDRDGNRAKELATRAYEQAPSRPEIVDTYGWVLFKNGRERDGLAALQQALVIAPRNAEIALHVAEALHELGRDAEARPMLERVLRDNPNSEFAESARRLLERLRG